MNRALMQVAIDALAFLELSDRRIVDPDAAVGQIENIAFLLKSMPADDRQSFANFVNEKATEAEREHDSERAAFLRSLTEVIGLTS